MRSSLTIIVMLAALLGGCALLVPRIAEPVQIRERVHVAPLDPASSEQLGEAREVIEERLTNAGIEARVELTETGIVVAVDPADRERATRLATMPGRIQFVPVPPEYDSQVQDGQPLPEGMDATPLFSGDRINVARLGSESNMGQPVVDFELDDEAARIFDEHASGHQGERFAIVLDGRVISAPSINAPQFNGRGQLSGNFSPESAEELVAILTAGSLPIELEATAVEEGPRPS